MSSGAFGAFAKCSSVVNDLIERAQSLRQVRHLFQKSLGFCTAAFHFIVPNERPDHAAPI